MERSRTDSRWIRTTFCLSVCGVFSSLTSLRELAARELTSSTSSSSASGPPMPVTSTFTKGLSEKDWFASAVPGTSERDTRPAEIKHSPDPPSQESPAVLSDRRLLLLATRRVTAQGPSTTYISTAARTAQTYHGAS